MSSPARVGRIGPGLSLLGQILLLLAPVQILQGGFENWLSIKLGLSAGADEAVDLVIAHSPGGVSHADEGSFLEVVRAVVAGFPIKGDLRDFYGYNSPSLDLLQAEEQYAASCAVGEGGKGLEEVCWGACVGGLGFHALCFFISLWERRSALFPALAIPLVLQYIRKNIYKINLSFYSVKPINGHRPIFSICKIYQLNLIVGNDRPQGIALIKLGDRERFIIQTNGTGKTFAAICLAIQLECHISCEDAALLLCDSKNEASVFRRIGVTYSFIIRTPRTSPNPTQVWNFRRTDTRGQEDHGQHCKTPNLFHRYLSVVHIL
jgi:hypothetical protein